MDNAKKHSDHKLTQPIVKQDVSDNSMNLEFTLNDVTPTNNRLAKKSKKFSNPEYSHYISQCSGKSMGLMEIFKLKNLLNYKDLRSVLNWCAKNDVFVIQQGNKQFVNKWEFILSFYKPFIKHLKKKHKNWKEMFLNYLNGELSQILNRSTESSTTIGSGTYKPKTKKETSFLNQIKKL